MRLQQAAGDGSTQAFAEWLLRVGDGNVLSSRKGIQLPPHLYLPHGSTTPDLIHKVYINIQSLNTDNLQLCMSYFADRVILAPLNHTVDRINQTVLMLMPTSEERTYLSADTAVQQDDTPVGLPQEYLNLQTPNGFPLHSLHLKIGSPVILLRNIAPPDGLCNGTRMIVTKLGSKVLGCSILTGTHKGTHVLIPRICLLTDPSDYPFILKRTQFPVRPAFAISINKSQGQSLSSVGLDLSVPVFSHGQLYVGLSRATRVDSVTVLLPEGEEDGRTLNVVYSEVFTSGNEVAAQK